MVDINSSNAITPTTDTTHDLNAHYAGASKADLFAEIHHNLSFIQAALNHEDLSGPHSFGLSNFVGHTRELINLAETRE